MTENAYRKVTEDELEYERREARFKYQLQRNTELSVARNEGEAIGLKKGRNEGAAQEKREIAKSMKEKKLDLSIIAEITGLTPTEIEAL